jgi:hypothetical protein
LRFLERKIKEPSGYLVAMWAAEELCDRGSIALADTVSAFITRLYSGPSGEEMVAFCRARIEIVNRNQDRAVALGTTLRTDASFRDQRIISWAIGQLMALRSDEADGILDRYATEVENRFPDVPAVTSELRTVMHIGFAREIRLERAVRRRTRGIGTSQTKTP